ncbi:MAG: lactonase family protein [Terriglobales bacterium]
MKSTIPCRIRLHMIGVLLLLVVVQSPFGFEAAAWAAGKDLVYIGTYTDHGSKGIYVYRFDGATGQVTTLGVAAESPQPSFLTVDPTEHFLYAVNELDTYKGQHTGAVSGYSIDAATGKLSLLNEVSSRDAGPAHITLDQTGKYALVSNYTLGSVAVFPVLQDGRLGDFTDFVRHKGSSVNVERQEGPHAHAVALSADNRFALVADLGLDQILVYPFDAVAGTLGHEPHITKTHLGAGPRHLVFDPSGKFLYVINEMQSTVVSYSYDAARGELHELKTISTLPEKFAGNSDAAEVAVHPSGKFLYASNRGHDSIAVFSIDPVKGALTRVEFVPTKGKTPRNFAIDPTGSWLFVANQASDDVVVFRIDGKTGHLTPTGQVLSVASPACVTFVPLP